MWRIGLLRRLRRPRVRKEEKQLSDFIVQVSAAEQLHQQPPPPHGRPGVPGAAVGSADVATAELIGVTLNPVVMAKLEMERELREADARERVGRRGAAGALRKLRLGGGDDTPASGAPADETSAARAGLRQLDLDLARESAREARESKAAEQRTPR